MPIYFSRDDVIAWAGMSTFVKALSYLSKVKDASWSEGQSPGSVYLQGRVQGQARRPYDVVVFLYREDGELQIAGDCTCPVGALCKHITALLLVAQHQLTTPLPAHGEVDAWLQRLRVQRAARVADQAAVAVSKQGLAYVLTWPYQADQATPPQILLYKGNRGKSGAFTQVRDPWNNIDAALVHPPQFVDAADLRILRALLLNRRSDDYGRFMLHGSHGAETLNMMLASGRLYARKHEMVLVDIREIQLLHPAAARDAQLVWGRVDDDRMLPMLRAGAGPVRWLATDPPCYIDMEQGACGELRMPWPVDDLMQMLGMPSISFAEVPRVAAALQEMLPDVPLPPSVEGGGGRCIDVEPVPVLHLYALEEEDEPIALAALSFQYEDQVIRAEEQEGLRWGTHDEVIDLRRRPASEARYRAELERWQLRAHAQFAGAAGGADAYLTATDRGAWGEFMKRAVPALRDEGWQVRISAEFPYAAQEIDAIEGQLQQGDDGWYDVEMGVIVGDRRLPLQSLLLDLFERDRRWLGGRMAGIPDDEVIELFASADKLWIDAARLKPVVQALLDLFERRESLRLSPWDIGRMDLLESTGRWQFHGDAALRDLVIRLRAGGGMPEVDPPRGLQAELRPYQRQGLAWMQYLRRHDLSGVLADDMGLGKTVQTLAHLQCEKEAGRLDRPALIVLPTTLLHNWMEEAQRFTPELKVLNLHGAQRKDLFARIAAHDLVLTTYALIWRDRDVLQQQDYHLLILDEAHYVKNARTRAAETIRQLRARHRLCLTGTPMENHLGELWSQFDFLMPGFLGTLKDFTQRWRTPIEKSGDRQRRDLLVRRLRPFMLRRRKDEVAGELPEKTVIVRSVELEQAQRDLYEAVRMTLQEKVRAAIDRHGLAKSQIIVLDALLKLRQVCCHPRLAHDAVPSAKLELLLEMLPALIAEGRRILLFSQFTTMLELIAAALEKCGITYVTLTGESVDRTTPVQRFQQGEVAVFLISLKAGGVGLNLTTADTVIHYDPWWNPAVEQQATDRAHRLGQEKAVFVYRLIVAGSIEEKILALQDKKSHLIDAVLGGDGATTGQFSADELAALLQPLPPIDA